MTVRYNPLAIERYNARKAALTERIRKGELEPAQAKLQLGEFVHDLIGRIKAREKDSEKAP